MSLGVPPIITDIPGNRELVVDGESGLVVAAKNSEQLGDAMLRIFKDKDLYEKIARNTKSQISDRLNHVQTIEKSKAFYESILA